jgi:hypothetical protein
MKLNLARREAVIIQEALEIMLSRCSVALSCSDGPEASAQVYYKMRIIEDIQGEIISELKNK